MGRLLLLLHLLSKEEERTCDGALLFPAGFEPQQQRGDRGQGPIFSFYKKKKSREINTLLLRRDVCLCCLNQHSDILLLLLLLLLLLSTAQCTVAEMTAY